MWIGIFIVCFLIIQIVIEDLLGLKLLVFGFNADFIRLILVLILIMLPVLRANVNLHRWMRVIRCVYTILTILAALFIFFVYMFLFSEKKYFYFKNPDKTRTLVVEECSWLLAGRSNFYERKYVIFIKYTEESITTDDGFRPFSNNAYRLKWVDNFTAHVSYDFGSGGYWNDETVKLK